RPGLDRPGEMRKVSDTAERDYRDRRCLRDRRDQCEIVAGAGAVAVDRVQQDLARTPPRRLGAPFSRILPGRGATKMGEYLILARAATAHVDAHHHRLAAEFLRTGGDQVWIRERLAVQRDLVGAEPQALPCVFERADLAADRQWHETARCNEVD